MVTIPLTSQPLPELHERIRRIAARANVPELVAIDAVLGEARVASSLASLTATEYTLALGVARHWDAEGSDAFDPGPFVLHRAAEQRGAS